MVQRCKHCGQTVMATDKQCWHCGKPLSPTHSRVAKAPQLATAVLDENQNQTPMPPFTTILLYAGLTAVALVILMVTTRAIGQTPLFVASTGSIAPAGWQPFTDSQVQYTLNLPETWHTLDMTRAPDAITLRSSPPLQAIDQIFDALVADTEFLFLGTEDTAVFANGSPVFVLIAHSQRLQRLPSDEVVGYAQEQLPENVTLSAVNHLGDLNDEETGSLLFNIEQDEALWRCLEQIGPGEEGIYLVVTCTSFAQFPRHQSDFEAILRSFQPLGS